MSRASFAGMPPACGILSACLSRSLPVFVICLACLLPMRVRAQSPPRSSDLRFRDRVELELLGELSTDVRRTAGLRLTYQRRRTLRTSTSLSGLVLLDPLSNSVGVAAGQMLTLAGAHGLLEPFAEIGVAYADARVPEGTYRVRGLDSASARVIHRYRAVRGITSLVGTGVTWAGMAGERTAVRLSLGYWQLAGANGFHNGSFRVGVSLGRARRDPRWFARATDRLPPEAVVVGRGAVEGDSVEAVSGAVSIVAADASGIARVRVNGKDIPYGPAHGNLARMIRTTTDVVAGSAPVDEPGGVERLDVAVRDSVGLTTHLSVWAYAGPDGDPPSVSILGLREKPNRSGPRIQALADDPSGIADAHVGVCPLELTRPAPDPVTLAPKNATARLVQGWAVPRGGSTLDVRDRVGNTSHTPLPPLGPEGPAGTEAPMLKDVAAVQGWQERGRTSVRVRGTVVDSSSAWIASVEVNGEPATLRVDDGPSTVTFDGWVLAPTGADSVEVVATASDGRTGVRRVAIGPASPRRQGRLRILVIAPEVLPGTTTDAAGPDLGSLTRRAGDGHATVLLGKAATRTAVLRALSTLQRQTAVEPEDVVFVDVEGKLEADATAVVPSISLASGHLDVGRLGRLLRTLQTRATLVSAHLERGHTWRIPWVGAPGAPPPAGCYEDTSMPPGRVIDLRSAPLRRVLAGLAGAADRDGDGRVVMGELLSYVGVAQRKGMLPFDPLALVGVAGGAR